MSFCVSVLLQNGFTPSKNCLKVKFDNSILAVPLHAANKKRVLCLAFLVDSIAALMCLMMVNIQILLIHLEMMVKQH